MRQALGKGIGALIPAAGPRGGAAAAPATDRARGGERSGLVREIPLSAIAVNPHQPRETFDEAALAELASSIATHGVLQPILVRATGAEAFELIAGERRLRAARIAGLGAIPALVREADANDSLVLAIVENIQRAELSALEEARAYRHLVDDFALTQEEVAARVGKSRPAVANTLRLLTLPDSVQADLAAGRISAGHARALLTLDGDTAKATLAREVVQRRLSVRDTEAAAQRARAGSVAPPVPHDPDVRRLAEDLSRALGTKVSIHCGREGGRVEIAFYSDDDLARLGDLLLAAGRGGAPRAARA